MGGAFESAGDTPAQGIASFDGQAWAAFGPGFPLPVVAITTLDDGSGPQVFAAGNGVLHRWDGSSWHDVGIVDGIIRALEVFDDGAGPALFVGGVDLRVRREVVSI